MKSFASFFLLFLMCFAGLGQATNSNTMVVSINDAEFTTQPRRITIGSAGYVTGNTAKPDKSLRVWFGNFAGKTATDSGLYLIVDADKPDTKENLSKAQNSGKYKGIATIKYSEETKEPRMEYHVGVSQNNDEYIEVKQLADGFMEMTFSQCTLEGSFWKEKASATVFGGLGRIRDKIENKVISQATGFDVGMDPEGNGYKRQDNTDKIVLKNGVIKLKME